MEEMKNNLLLKKTRQRIQRTNYLIKKMGEESMEDFIEKNYYDITNVVEEGKRLLENTTPGEWWVETGHNYYGTHLKASSPVEKKYAIFINQDDHTFYPNKEGDVMFIAWAKNNMDLIFDALDGYYDYIPKNK